MLKKTQSGAKLLSQSRNIPVGCRLRRCQYTKLYAGTWNVHSLVEESGDCRVCCARGAFQYDTTMERKLDLLVAELKSYNIFIAGIQETKWLGLKSGPLVSGPSYIQVMSCHLMATLVLDEMVLEFCWTIGLLLRGDLLKRFGELCHLGLCMPD